MKQPRHAFLSLPLGMCSLGSTLLALPGKIRGRTSASAGILSAFAGRIQPRPFFAGLLLGTVTMLGLGHWARQHDTYGDRVRFFQAITPEKSVYPTIDNLAAFVRGKADPKKILVLVSGSSICLGIGQPDEDLWSRRLQAELGDDFAVVNASFRANRFNQIGVPLAQMLDREYPRWILISDAGPLDAAPASLRSENPGSPPYNYIAWQGVARAMLAGQSWAFQQAWRELSRAQLAERAYLQEKLLAGGWEALSGASAFWNWIGYRGLFTANIFCYPIQPVMLKRDDEDKKYYLPSPERFLGGREKEMKILQGQIASGRAIAQNASARSQALTSLTSAFPDDSFIRRTVFFLNCWASFYVEALPLGDRKFYQNFAQDRVGELRRAGFGAALVGLNYPHSFYVDGQHFSWDGAPRVARDVAAEVMRVARRQEYLP